MVLLLRVPPYRRRSDFLNVPDLVALIAADQVVDSAVGGFLIARPDQDLGVGGRGQVLLVICSGFSSPVISAA